MKHVVIHDYTFKTGIEDYDMNCTACDSECSSKLVSEFSGSYCPWTPERGSNFGHGPLGYASFGGFGGFGGFGRLGGFGSPAAPKCITDICSGMPACTKGEKQR